MNYLIDTHALIFFGCGDEHQIGKKALQIFKNPKSKLFVCQISYWEMAIKINVGKLTIPIGLKNLMLLTRDAGIELVPVANQHILHYQSLPVMESHKDPFDRYLIAAALSEKMKILSRDRIFDGYPGVVRIWE
ncbi:MAG: type II toxin-antitoxin system VapC family toxin [Thermodesulfobacteriota bacterium]